MHNRSSQFIIKNLSDNDKKSNATLENEIKQKRDKQDELLEQIHSGVTRLKELAVTINGELTSQNASLDELAQEVEVTDKKIQDTTQKTRELEVSINSSSCVIL